MLLAVADEADKKVPGKQNMFFLFFIYPVLHVQTSVGIHMYTTCTLYIGFICCRVVCMVCIVNLN